MTTSLWTPANVNGVPMTLYYAPAGTAQPADTAALAGTVPSAPWVNPGSTTEGFTIATSATVTDWEIEEQDAPTKRRIKRVTSIKATLAEARLENFKLAAGGGTLALTAGSGGTPTKRQFTFTDDYDELAVFLTSQDLVSVTRASTAVDTRLCLYIPRVSASGELEEQFRRRETYRKYALELTSLSPGSDIAYYELSAGS